MAVVETAGGDAGLIAGLLEWAAAQPKPKTLTPCRTDIIVTAPLPPFLYEPLKADFRCHDYVQAVDKPAFLATQGPVIRGLVQGGGTVTPTTLLDALPALEIISVFGVGYDGVPVDYCSKRGLKVTNTPDVLTDDVADVAVALIMMTGRGFVRLNRFVQAGEWLKRGPELTTKLGGRTVGILGLGRIGKAIAQRVSAMGMNVAYTGRKPQDVPYRFIPDLKALAAAADFLVVACPGGAATKNIVECRGAGGAWQEGHDRQHRARLDRRRAGARRRARSPARSRPRASTCSPTSPTSRSRSSRWTTWCCCRTSAARRAKRGKAMGDLCKANLDAWFAGKPLPTLIAELA